MILQSCCDCKTVVAPNSNAFINCRFSHFARLSEALSSCLKRSEELCKKRDFLSSQLYSSQQASLKRDSYGKSKPQQNLTGHMKVEKSMQEKEVNAWKISNSLSQQPNGRVTLFKSARASNNNSFGNDNKSINNIKKNDKTSQKWL